MYEGSTCRYASGRDGLLNQESPHENPDDERGDSHASCNPPRAGRQRVWLAIARQARTRLRAGRDRDRLAVKLVGGWNLLGIYLVGCHRLILLTQEQRSLADQFRF